jgi:hypothetical protein
MSEDILTKNILDAFKKFYPQLNNVKLLFQENNKFNIAQCEVEPYGDHIYIGKMRYKFIIPKTILLSHEKNIVMSLLHEITHAITPQYERKIKNEWIILDHSNKFYQNFLIICNIAYKQKIINKQFNIKELYKFDHN